MFYLAIRANEKEIFWFLKDAFRNMWFLNQLGLGFKLILHYSYKFVLPSQRGSEDVMIYLSKEAHKGKVRSILFLMPCHSTPYYSTLHHDLPMWFLDCTPRWLFKILSSIFFPWHIFLPCHFFILWQYIWILIIQWH